MAKAFDNIVQDTISAFESVWGDDVVYTLASGSSSTITADLEIDDDEFVEVGRGENRTRRATIIGRTSDIGGWSRDDTFTYSGDTWQIDREEGRDAAFVRLRLSRSDNERRVVDNERIRRVR